MAMLGTVLFVVALAASIAIHEWGHFLTARWFGMRAERYFIGFGPTVWSTHRGETEYGVKALPFGGFVRIAGMAHGDRRLAPVAAHVFDRDAVASDREDAATTAGVALAEVPAVPGKTWTRLDAELERRGVPETTRQELTGGTRDRLPADATAQEAADVFREVAATVLPATGKVGDLRHRVLRGDEGRFFKDRPAWQRAIVLSAGSGMHFIQAIVLLFVAFWAFGVEPTTTIAEVLPDTPAAEAGLDAGDRLVAVGGERLGRFEEARELLSARPGEPVEVTVERDGSTETVRMTPAIVVGDLPPDSEAAAAGLAPRDRIIAIDGQEVSGLADVRGATGEVTLTVERYVAEDGETRTERAELQLAAEALDEVELTGMAGFVPDVSRMGLASAVRETFVGEGSFPAMVGATFQAFGAILGPEGLGALPEQLAGAERNPTGASLASPVGLAQVAGEGTATAGLFFLLGLLAALNVFIGIFNLVPLPPLDGGHLAVLAVERTVNAVRARRGVPTDYEVDPRTITAIALPVIVVLGLVFIAVLILDITNPLQLPQ